MTVSLDDIQDEFYRLEEIRKKGNWFDPRNPENYILDQYHYSFGDRNYYRIPDENYQLYKDLQASRGIKDLLEQDINDYISEFENSAYHIDQNNTERINELNQFVDIDSIDSFYELGFRTPTLLNYWNNRGLCVKGYDVVKVNVMVSSHLGWDVEEYDLSLYETPLEFEENSLVISYHCFEHLINPLKALQGVYNDMKSNSFFHIEIPTEQLELPGIKHAHLQSFYHRDLECLVNEVGFEIINVSMKHDIDRVLAKK